MTRGLPRRLGQVALAALVALAAATLALVPACHKRKPLAAPPPEAFDLLLPSQDCLVHAVAAAALADSWLVAAACGANDLEGHEQITAVRIDERGVAGRQEDVQILTTGWATNVLLAPIASGGALLVWTTAVEGRASASALPLDVQGRPTGETVLIADGRALAMAGGRGGAAVAVVTEPDSLSDDVDAPGAMITVYALDPDGQVIGRQVVTTGAQAVRPYVSLAARAGGYTVAWPERGGLVVAQLGERAELGARSVASPNPAAVGLPPQARFWTPAVVAGEAGAARIAAVVSGGTPIQGGDPSGELWIGEGTVGAPFTWKPAAVNLRARLGGLALAGAATGPGALAWSQTTASDDFASVSVLFLPPTAPPAIIIPAAVLFDGAVALASRGARYLVAAAVPPSETGQSGIAIALRTNP